MRDVGEVMTLILSTSHRCRVVGLVALLSAPAVLARGQEAPGHVHAAPAARLGAVHMTTSCAPAVAPAFDRGLALLHSFWFSASVEAFTDVLARDPGCVMAHWGIALNWWGNPFATGRSPQALVAGQRAIDTARTSGAGTERERGYVDAAALLFADAATI